ncbi:hypothetical protein [Devosia sp. 1566]|uniref:hypothetical protein n=1 Tax=Devosia sp. 1566 TaxID=2499144 RepID=UPI000FD7EE67|nr:hypothetical protein [Devosia sp. 1566]
MSDVPGDILAAIKLAAKEEWPGDTDMQDYFIQSECDGYAAILELDFGPAEGVREQILESADGYSSLWEEKASFVAEEVEAFAELSAWPEDVPRETVSELKRQAAQKHDWFTSQRDEIEGGLSSFRYVRDTREKVGPLRDLLVRMEAIIGNECYNDNIQNYGSWGVWEGEGRSFRYPVTMIRNGEPEKRRTSMDGLQPEELITGHYRFGANELSIYRALVKIIEMLEAEYDLKVPR